MLATLVGAILTALVSWGLGLFSDRGHDQGSCVGGDYMAGIQIGDGNTAIGRQYNRQNTTIHAAGGGNGNAGTEAPWIVLAGIVVSVYSLAEAHTVARAMTAVICVSGIVLLVTLVLYMRHGRKRDALEPLVVGAGALVVEMVGNVLLDRVLGTTAYRRAASAIPNGPLTAKLGHLFVHHIPGGDYLSWFIVASAVAVVFAFGTVLVAALACLLRLSPRGDSLPDWLTRFAERPSYGWFVLGVVLLLAATIYCYANLPS